MREGKEEEKKKEKEKEKERSMRRDIFCRNNIVAMVEVDKHWQLRWWLYIGIAVG